MNPFRSPKVEPLLIDRETAAKLLGCSLRHVINLERTGKLRPIRLGAAVRHSKAFIDRLIEVEQLRLPGDTGDLSFLY